MSITAQKMKFLVQISLANLQNPQETADLLKKSLTEMKLLHCTKKCSFPLRISSANVAKSAVSCEFGHIY